MLNEELFDYILYVPEVLWVLTFLILFISVLIDRRRFRNSFLLLFHLIAIFFLVLKYSIQTGTGFLLVLIALLVALWMFLSIPFLLIFNGFVVMRKEGIRIANVLSLALGVGILIGFYSFSKSVVGIFSGTASRYEIFAWMIISTLMFHITFIFVAFLIYSIFHHYIPRRTTFDFIIVLGAGLINGERVTPLLAARCNKAIKIYKRSFSACKIICSGGQGPDEKISEAQAMKNYLLEQGIPEDDILLEDQSKTTKENLINSKEILSHKKGRKQIAVVTSNFHVLRAVIYAREINLECDGIGARTAFYYWPTAMIREYIALMKYYLPWFTGGLLLLLFLEAALLKFLT